MRVLLSGASGFIGGDFLRRLVADGHEVTALTRRLAPWLRPLQDACRWVTCDLAQPLDAPPSGPFDLFLHLAGANDVDSRDPEAALRDSALTTRNALELCRRVGVPRFLYFSTFQVYGPVSGTVDERTPTSCVNDYALTHLFAEEYVRAAGRRGELSWVIARPTNVFGAPLHRDVDRWGLVPACFCTEAAEAGSVTLRSSGRQLRDFIPLAELYRQVDAISRDFERAANRVFNLATGVSTPIVEVARRVAARYRARTGRPCELVVTSDDPGAVAPFRVDPAALRSIGVTPDAPPRFDEEIDRLLDLLPLAEDRRETAGTPS